MFGDLGGPELALIALMVTLGLVLVALPASRICARVGFSPWLGPLAVIPVVNLALLWFVALAAWPKFAERELDASRNEV